MDIFGLPLIFVPPYLAGLHTFDLVRGCVCRPCRAPIDLIILDLIRSSIEQSFHYEVDLGSKFSIQLANASPVLLNWEETSWDPRDEGARGGYPGAKHRSHQHYHLLCNCNHQLFNGLPDSHCSWHIFERKKYIKKCSKITKKTMQYWNGFLSAGGCKSDISGERRSG